MASKSTDVAFFALLLKFAVSRIIGPVRRNIFFADREQRFGLGIGSAVSQFSPCFSLHRRGKDDMYK